MKKNTSSTNTTEENQEKINTNKVDEPTADTALEGTQPLTDSTAEAKEVPAPTETIKEKKKEKPIKQIKNVSIKQCIGTILFSLFALCVALIPVTFGNTGINMTFKALPIIGDGTINNAQLNSSNGISALFKLSESLSKTIAMLLNVATIAYFIILVADIVFSLFLAITRFQKIRIFFKIYSILAGIAMIFVLIMSIVHIIGFAGLIIKGIIPINTVMTAIETSAILTAIGIAIMSSFLIGKQFKWFEKLY